MNINHVKVEVLIPEGYIVPLRNQLNEMGVLTVGDYDHVISYSYVKGYWKPLETANPYQGEIGKVSFGEECKLEFKCLYEHIDEAKEIIKHVHPYEEPVVNVLPLLN